jgi:hypothetical protein
MRTKPFFFFVVCGGALTAGVALWQGCSIYSTSLLLPGDAAPAEGGNPEAAVDGGDGCGHVRWPSRPANDDPGGGSYSFWNALSSVDFGVRDGGKPPVMGFDLDSVCTCDGTPPAPESCKPGPTAKSHCDDPGGIDNQGEQLIVAFSAYSGFFDQGFINGRLANGYYGALVRIRNYNGLPNDTQVEVSVYSSNGTEGVQQGVPSTPLNDGNDVWTIDPNSLLGGVIPDSGEPIPRDAVDPNAYVANGMLVANLNVPLSVGAGNGEGTVTIDLSGSVVVGKLVAVGNTFRIENGLIAGRWNARKMLTGLKVLFDPLDTTQHLCGTDPVYQGLKQIICKYPDLTGNVQEDGKNAPCDSISIGFSFNAGPARSGTTPALNDGADVRARGAFVVCDLGCVRDLRSIFVGACSRRGWCGCFHRRTHRQWRPLPTRLPTRATIG